MDAWTELLLILFALTNLTLVGFSRQGACIRMTAAQGLLLGLLTWAVQPGGVTLHLAGLVVGVWMLKGIVFPWLLFRAVRGAEMRREMQPFVGFAISILIGTVAFPVSFWLASRLPLPHLEVSPLAMPVAFHAVLLGLFLIVSRRKAVMQVVGYLVMENGVYIFGISLVHGETLLVDLGILLDIFVGVFVMGIAIFHISREFDHIDTDRLSTLRDLP